MADETTSPQASRSYFGNLSELFWFTLLLPTSAVLLVFGTNVQRIPVSKLLIVIALAVAIFIASAIIVRILLRGSHRADTITAALFIGAFWGVYVMRENLEIWAFGWIAVAIASLFIAKVYEITGFMAKCIGLSSLGVAALGAFNSPVLYERSELLSASAEAFSELPTANTIPETKRDVYYIVLDRYARADQLKSLYGFDNSPFLNELKSRGFLVADQAYSNYPRTGHSLASSLNLDFLDRLSGGADEPKTDWVPIYDLIENSVAARFFKSQGYDFDFYGSWWEPTRANAIADRVVNFHDWPEILRLIFEVSVFGQIADQYGITAINPRDLQCSRAKQKFETLRNSVSDDASGNPRFVFAHFLVPHPPFVIGADGQCLSTETVASRSREQNFVEQVQYANSEVLRFLDAVDAMDGPKPIIILQADEGPWPKRMVVDEIHFLARDVSNANWATTTPVELREKMAILNAVRFPEKEAVAFSDDMTPVNNFRLVLNAYFGADLPILPNEKFIFPSNEDLYGFENVDAKLGSE